MIDRFLNNTEVSVCGSRMLILVKRYPNEIDVSQIVAKMRHYHSYLTIVASRDPTGGNQPGILYDIASKTNGLCGFDKDSEIGEAVQYTDTRYTPYIEYAVNPQVSGSGTIQLAPLLVPNYNNYWFQMTIQDDGPVSAVQNVFLSWANEKDHGLMGYNGTYIRSNGYGNHLSGTITLNEFTYNVTLDYEYSDTKSRRLQIRVYGSVVSPVSVWPPYDN
ncbi:unnamed protein product [Caenorhabditis brenneri]